MEKTGPGETEGEEVEGEEVEGEEVEGEEVEGEEVEGEEVGSCGLLYCWWSPVTTEALGGLEWATVAKDWPCLSTNRELAGSTMKPYCFKKSTPTMGKFTAANRNGQEKTRP